MPQSCSHVYVRKGKGLNLGLQMRGALKCCSTCVVEQDARCEPGCTPCALGCTILGYAIGLALYRHAIVPLLFVLFHIYFPLSSSSLPVPCLLRLPVAQPCNVFCLCNVFIPFLVSWLLLSLPSFSVFLSRSKPSLTFSCIVLPFTCLTYVLYLSSFLICHFVWLCCMIQELEWESDPGNLNGAF